MGIDYQSASTVTRHDNVYTVLLGVPCIKAVFAILQIGSIRSRLPFNSTERDKLLGSMVIAGICFFLLLTILLIRLIFPAYRRWPTLGLNLILLPFIPFGTALAIYGFWKVDKKLR